VLLGVLNVGLLLTAAWDCAKRQYFWFDRPSLAWQLLVNYDNV